MTSSCDCVVAYTCRCGLGWDEVCDNQRWAVNKILNGRTVFHVNPHGRATSRRYSKWAASQRHAAYRTLVQGKRSPREAQCQLDEFPQGDLRESGNNNPQGCRLVNGPANGAQGIDYKMWKMAQWRPCSSYRRFVCNINDDGPPVTWKFGTLIGNRGSGSGQRFLSAYGFNSQTPGSECFASYSYTAQGGSVDNTMIVDHGFRVLDDDPMYGRNYGWPRQSWLIDPGPQNAAYRASNIQPGIFQRSLTVGAIGNETDSSSADSGVCHANLGRLSNAQAALDNLFFVDMNGDPIDGRECSVIYDGLNPDSALRIGLDEEGNLAWIEDEKRESPMEVTATKTADPVTITVTQKHAANSEPRPTVPAATQYRKPQA